MIRAKTMMILAFGAAMIALRWADAPAAAPGPDQGFPQISQMTQMGPHARTLSFSSAVSATSVDPPFPGAGMLARLEALRPSEPMAYFELAEEVADAGSGQQTTAATGLARHLFGLAGALDPEHLGRSACLALADLEDNAQSKRRLLALASLLESGLSMPGGAVQPAGAAALGGMRAALAVGEAFSRFRRGQGAQALAALRTPGAVELLQQYDRMLPGGVARFLEDCKAYKTQTKPLVSSGDLARMLRLESALLAGGDRPWSDDLLVTASRPLVEVDPARLEESLGVDASKPLFRNGRWAEK